MALESDLDSSPKWTTVHLLCDHGKGAWLLCTFKSSVWHKMLQESRPSEIGESRDSCHSKTQGSLDLNKIQGSGCSLETQSPDQNCAYRKRGKTNIVLICGHSEHFSLNLSRRQTTLREIKACQSANRKDVNSNHSLSSVSIHKIECLLNWLYEITKAYFYQDCYNKASTSKGNCEHPKNRDPA